MAVHRVQGAVGGRDLYLETGKLAKLAGGAVTIGLGETQLLVTATAGKHPKEQLDFMPLTVDVEERMYAAGKIPGGFFRREGRPSETAILTARLVDRPLRPSFPKGMRNEIHVVATIMSTDMENLSDVLAIKKRARFSSDSSSRFHVPWLLTFRVATWCLTYPIGDAGEAMW